MRYVKCPECGEQAEYSEKNEHRPFCSRRCQLLDLGAWASEQEKKFLTQKRILRRVINSCNHY